MITVADAITASAVAFAGVTTAIASGLRAGHEHHTETAPRPHPARPAAPDAYVPCHDVACAHMTMPHDRTPAGLVCRSCRTTKEAL